MGTEDEFAAVITAWEVNVEVFPDRSGVEIHEARTLSRHSVVLTRSEAWKVREALNDYLRIPRNGLDIPTGVTQ